MKLTLEMNGKKYSTEADNDDFDVHEMFEYFSGLLVSATYSPISIRNVICELAEEYSLSEKK